MEPHDTTPTQTNPTDLDLDAAVAGVVNPVCERLGIRAWLKGQHLHTVMLEMVSLDANGAREDELMAYGLALIDLARTLKQQPMCERTLERMVFEADIADDHLRGIMHIEGESPVMLEARAAAREKAGALNFAGARQDRRRAREIRTQRTTARQRVGLGGAA